MTINQGRKFVKKYDGIDRYRSKHHMSFKPDSDGKKRRGKGKREEEGIALAPDHLMNCTCKGCPSIRRSEMRQT